MTRGAAALFLLVGVASQASGSGDPVQLNLFFPGPPPQISPPPAKRPVPRNDATRTERRRLSGPQFQQGLSCRSGHDVAATNVDAGGREGAIQLFGGGGGRDGGT